MPRRLVVFGPESTGKTTLAQALAQWLACPWSKEYVREYWEAHEGRIGPADLEAIARGQVAAEEEAWAQAAGLDWVVHDTDLLTCLLWDDLLFPGACPPTVRAQVEPRTRAVALYLFCQTDLPFEPDPQRCFPDEQGRSLCLHLWHQALVSRGLPFVEISGTQEQRLQAALEALRLLALPD